MLSFAFLPFIAIAFLPSIHAQVCGTNYLGSYFFVQATGNASLAAQVCESNGLLLANVPDLVVGASLGAVLLTCAGWSTATAHVKGYQGVTLSAGCWRMTATGLLSFLTGANNCETSAATYALCTNDEQLAIAVDPLLVSVQVSIPTTIVNIIDSLLSSIVTLTADLNSLTVTTGTTTITSTAQAPVSIAVSTLSLTLTSVLQEIIEFFETVTQTNILPTFAVTTISVPSVPLVFTQTQTVISPSTVTLPPSIVQTQTVTNSNTVTLPPDVIVSVLIQSVIVTESRLATTTVALPATTTVTVPASGSTSIVDSCPSSKLVSCPCRPIGNHVIVYNRVSSQQASCACQQIGGHLAMPDPSLASTLNRIFMNCNPGSIGPVHVNDEMLLYPDGHLEPALGNYPVLCRIQDSKCHHCQFILTEYCRQYCAIAPNGFDADCYEPGGHCLLKSGSIRHQDPMDTMVDDPMDTDISSTNELVDTTTDDMECAQKHNTNNDPKSPDQWIINTCPIIDTTWLILNSVTNILGGLIDNELVCQLQGGVLADVNVSGLSTLLSRLTGCSLPSAYIKTFLNLDAGVSGCVYVLAADGSVNFKAGSCVETRGLVCLRQPLAIDQIITVNVSVPVPTTIDSIITTTSLTTTTETRTLSSTITLTSTISTVSSLTETSVATIISVNVTTTTTTNQQVSLTRTTNVFETITPTLFTQTIITVV